MISPADIGDALGAFLGHFASPAWMAARYERKADRLYRRWLSMPETEQMSRKGMALLRRMARFETRAQDYREKT